MSPEEYFVYLVVSRLLQHRFIIIAIIIIISSWTNRTLLKDGFYAVGAMKKGKSSNVDYKDNLLLFLGVEAISDVTFFSRLQIGESVFHSRAYKRVSRRNNYTIAYQ